ncbi:hypothetical protein [Catenulispora sp. EB89]|uniref:hypothetical protein n=1 Tax=Catenulispora sp. EB89 TaxID=3156257 RepID=UPI003512A03A
MPGRLELRTRISRVGLDGREYRVIRPDRPATRLVLHDNSFWYSGFADREALTQLATLWSLAAVSPHSIIHVPTRHNASPFEGRSVDLVLSYALHQLRPSRWKAIRTRLGNGAPHKIHVPDFADTQMDYNRLRYREYRDRLNFDSASDTLFVTGSRESFQQSAHELSTVLAEAIRPGTHRHDAARHVCAELAAGGWPPARTRHGTPGMLHIQYYPDDWPARAA